MQDAPHQPLDPRTLMDELSFLQEKLETAVKERQEMYDELQKETARMQATMDNIYQSKSWQWTAPMRKLEWKLRHRRRGSRVMYRFFSHMKKLWMEMGSPCPRLVRFCRHSILGKIWPSRAEK